ncbi:MAG: hypothetical protein AMXMBFR84_00390 [Candidatus Hydrogenedentota bacterium]
MRTMPLLLAICLVKAMSAYAEAPSGDEARQALKRAAVFFNETVTVEGGYLWRYSADLAQREGEVKATATESWVQPPGTPTVGEAYLAAYEATGDPYYLEAARKSARALVHGQLQSGGWEYRLEAGTEKRKAYAFRADNNESGKNVSTLDDNTTQAALQFLMKFDKAVQFKDPSVHEAVEYALAKLMEVQFPNGAWPQRFSGPLDPAEHPVIKASYPESWSRDYVQRSYYGHYTFNDGGISDTIDTMLLAHDIYDITAYRDSAIKAGDFILLAQMPDPQPGWAQQYDANMHPAWARKFEPPAITGGESQGVMRTLIQLSLRTGERRFLEPIPRALAYYRASVLPDGRLARFYELQTNRPLFFTKDYQLTYSSDDMPTHYSFITSNSLDSIQDEYEVAVRTLDEKEGSKKSVRVPRAVPADPVAVREAIDGLDARGAWVTTGRLRSEGEDGDTRQIIDSSVFCTNIRILTAYIRARQ